MSDYDNTNRGSIWKNEKKLTDSHPDYTGSLNVDGIEYWVSGWKKKEGAAAKAPVLTFIIQPKDQPKQDARQPDKSKPRTNVNHDGFDDDDPGF